MRTALLAVGAVVIVAVNSLAVIYVIGAIQESRRDAIRLQCRELNARNDATVRELDTQLAQLAGGTRREIARVRAGTLSSEVVYRRAAPTLTPGRRREVRRSFQNRRGVVFLINALAPRRDCDKRVAQLVRP